MKNYTLCFLVISLSMICQSACTQNNEIKQKYPSGHIFKTNLRADGTAFYSMNNRTGQLHFMLDYGDQRGSWQKFGSPIRADGDNPLLFGVVERAGATSFYALDGQTGQLYYANDDEATQGKWNTYGDIIRDNGLNLLQFDVEGRIDGNSFFAFDSYSGQMYFLNDFGEKAGKWNKYGSPLAK